MKVVYMEVMEALAFLFRIGVQGFQRSALWSGSLLLSICLCLDAQAALVIVADSSNPTLLPSQNIQIQVQGTNMQVLLSPVVGQGGETIVTFYVSDGLNQTRLFPDFGGGAPTNGAPPTLDPIPSVTVTNGGSSPPILLSISDPDTDPNLLGFSRSTSDSQMIPLTNIHIDGTGTNRLLTVAAVPGYQGTATVSVAVTDGSSQATQTFSVRVLPPNRAPVVYAGTNTTLYASLSTRLKGTVSDDGLPLTPGRVSVTWSKASGPGVVTFGTPNLSLTSVKFTVPGLYTLRLTATDGELSAKSDVVYFVRLNNDTNPPVLTNVVATRVTSSSATIRWGSNEASDSQIEMTPEGEALSFSALDVTPVLLHQVEVTNLVPGKRYSFRARSRDAVGNKGYSTPISLSTLRAARVYTSLSADLATLQSPVVSGLDGSIPYLQTSVPNQGTATFPFFAPAPDSYFVWVRVMTPDVTQSKFSFGMDAATPQLQDVSGDSWTSDWKWTRLNGPPTNGLSSSANPRRFSLNVGDHQLVVAGADSGTLLSHVLLTNDPELVPSDTGLVGGIANPLQLLSPVINIPIASGWSLLGNPIGQTVTNLSDLLSGLPDGSQFVKWDGDSMAYLTNDFSANAWSQPGMTFPLEVAGFFNNPGSSLLWTLSGPLSMDSTPLSLTTGNNLVALRSPVSGFLTTFLDPPFVAGDTVQVLDPMIGDYRVHHFDGTKWDVIPVVNLGEGFFLNLVPR